MSSGGERKRKNYRRALTNRLCLPPHQAMKEVSGPIVAIALLSLCAVLLPEWRFLWGLASTGQSSTSQVFARAIANLNR